MKALSLLFVLVLPLAAREPLAQRIAHTDPAQYRPSKAVHDGAGMLNYMGLFDYHALDTNLQFLHRGVIEPKSGIGAHFHNTCEEMFVILDGEAEFTIDGRTSRLKGPAGAPSRVGHSHAIYNPGDQPVEWMNIAVGSIKGKYDNFDLNDDRVGALVDRPGKQEMVPRPCDRRGLGGGPPPVPKGVGGKARRDWDGRQGGTRSLSGEPERGLA